MNKNLGKAKKFTAEEREKIKAIIRKLKNEGLTCLEVTDRLNEGGIKTANGLKWTPAITGFYYYRLKRGNGSRKASAPAKLEASSDKKALAELVFNSKVEKGLKLKLLAELLS